MRPTFQLLDSMFSIRFAGESDASTRTSSEVLKCCASFIHALDMIDFGHTTTVRIAPPFISASRLIASSVVMVLPIPGSSHRPYRALSIIARTHLS